MMCQCGTPDSEPHQIGDLGCDFELVPDRQRPRRYRKIYWTYMGQVMTEYQLKNVLCVNYNQQLQRWVRRRR